MKVVFWGTYDTGKPRVRILLQGLRENGVEIVECHSDIWKGIDDKTRLKGWSSRLKAAARWLKSYPRLIFDYLCLPRHEAVVVGYLGHLDVLILWPFAKLRRIPIVWDAFISLYDTMVEDRNICKPKSIFGRLLYIWEWLACRAAELVILDTKAQADYFLDKYGLSSGKVVSVKVGVEGEFFSFVSFERKKEMPVRVLFYGQMIPLHGVETIIQSARILKEEPFEWTIIGRGQKEDEVRRMLDDCPLPNLNWVPWVPYAELTRWIGKADICLGIFGGTGKASRVIPNKVFQVLACGKPLVTMDSPAIRELLNAEDCGVFLVPPQNPLALSQVLQIYRSYREKYTGRVLHANIATTIYPKAIGRDLLMKLNAFLIARRPSPYRIDA